MKKYMETKALSFAKVNKKMRAKKIKIKEG